jgi:enoyl-CoA hydratase/carnithine racemase
MTTRMIDLAGGRAFCAGADLKEMSERDQTIAVGAPPGARPYQRSSNGCDLTTGART